MTFKAGERISDELEDLSETASGAGLIPRHAAASPTTAASRVASDL